MKQTSETTQALITLLQANGYRWQSYSGHGMFGKNCVGISLERETDLIAVGSALADNSALACTIGTPRTDSLGRGIIAYWPRAAL